MAIQKKQPISFKTVGRRVRAARKAPPAMTQTVAAAEAGISQGTWASVEAGTRAVSEETLARVLRVVNLPFDFSLLNEGAGTQGKLALCDNIICLGNQILVVHMENLLLPSLIRSPRNSCPHCQGDLLYHCRNCGAGIPGTIALYCDSCSNPWGPGVGHLNAHAHEHIKKFAQEIHSFKEYQDALRRANGSSVETLST